MEYENLIGGAISDKISIYNCDCMELLRQTPDNYYSLALVDPPYGIDHANKAGKMSGQKYGNAAAKKKTYTSKDWDLKTPEEKYWIELFRVSKNQIIWGGNYFPLPLVKGWIIWDKKTEDKYSNDFADCELAWSSFDRPAKIVRYLWSGMLQPDMKNKQKRIHPTEKPYQLYKWCLENYAKQGDKILDTHLGSGSIAIACHDYGFDLTACELDKEYFDKAMQRINNHVAQQKLF